MASPQPAAAVGTDDVEEFPWVEEAAAASPEKFPKVFDLVQRGNGAFREGQHDEAMTLVLQAISLYTKALLLKPGDPIILSNRSTAFYILSRVLRERPAVDSEYQPLYGLDPTTHAELALKDAEKILAVRGDSPKSYLLKANALILLERYDEARETLISGLQVDAFSAVLQNTLKDLEEKTNILGGAKRRKFERTDDFECTLCFKLLYEPVTTPCGHTFCRSCLHQSMDHGNKCPMCRMVLFISPRTYPISVTLNNIIQKSFPEEYAERRSENETTRYAGIELMPLFVMDVVLPYQKLSLNIFEPRYRLMVRRIMEGNHRMGMVGNDPGTSTIAEYACEVEILECQPLPDGRFYLEVEGRRRFRILRSWDQDGYRVAEIEWVDDTKLPEGSEEKAELIQMANGAAELARTWIRRARETGRIGRRSRQLEALESEGMPRIQDPESISFWLINSLGLRASEKLELLRLQSTRERITRGLLMLKAAEEQGCRVQ